MLETVVSGVRESVSMQAALVGTAVLLAVYQMTKRRYKLPPGPTSLPLLGNLLSFRKDCIYQKLIEWSKEYGPVITIYLGPMRCVALNNIEVTLEAMVQRGSDFAGRVCTYSGDAMSEGGKDIALGDYGPIWKIHRRLATKALRQYMAGRNLEKNVEATLKTLVELFEREKETFDPSRHFASAVANMLHGVCFNSHYATDDPELEKIVKQFLDLSDDAGNGFLEDVIPPLRLYPTRRFRVFKEAADWFFDIMAEKIKQHKETLDPNNPRDLTDMLLIMQELEKKENPEALEDVYIRQTIGDIFGAGIDTTRLTLSWVAYHMAVHPEIQKKCQEEVDAALGDREKFLLSDRERMPYTEATLHESMRVATVPPLALPHKTIKDSTVGGYEVPAGTMVIINMYALHYDPAHWPEPEKFRPERFLEDSGKLAPKPQSWLPFSAGHRNCLGEGVAKPELHLLFAGLLHKFTFSLPEGEPDRVDAGENTFARAPRNLRLVVTPRN